MRWGGGKGGEGGMGGCGVAYPISVCTLFIGPSLHAGSPCGGHEAPHSVPHRGGDEEEWLRVLSRVPLLPQDGSLHLPLSLAHPVPRHLQLQSAVSVFLMVGVSFSELTSSFNSRGILFMVIKNIK